MFLKSLQSLGSEEQIAKWTPLCNEFRIIASYAQTELGHGEPAFLHARKAHSQLSSQRLCISYGNIPAGGSQGSGRRGFPFLVYRNTPHELACVAQVVPSRNVSRHPLSRAGHVSPTQPTGERQEMPVSTAGSSPTPDEAGAWQFWAHQDAAPQVGILS